MIEWHYNLRPYKIKVSLSSSLLLEVCCFVEAPNIIFFLITTRSCGAMGPCVSVQNGWEMDDGVFFEGHLNQA